MPLFLEQLNQNMSEYFQRSRSDEIIGSPVHNPLLPLSPRAVRARARRERNERRASVRNERRSRQSDESEATTVEDVSSLQSDEIDGSSEVMMEFVLDEESSEDLLGREREEEQGMGDEVGLVMQEDSDDEEKGATLRDPLTLDDLGMHVYEFKVANSSHDIISCLNRYYLFFSFFLSFFLSLTLTLNHSHTHTYTCAQDIKLSFRTHPRRDASVFRWGGLSLSRNRH